MTSAEKMVWAAAFAHVCCAAAVGRDDLHGVHRRATSIAAMAVLELRAARGEKRTTTLSAYAAQFLDEMTKEG